MVRLQLLPLFLLRPLFLIFAVSLLLCQPEWNVGRTALPLRASSFGDLVVPKQRILVRKPEAYFF